MKLSRSDRGEAEEFSAVWEAVIVLGGWSWVPETKATGPWGSRSNACALVCGTGCWAESRSRCGLVVLKAACLLVGRTVSSPG